MSEAYRIKRFHHVTGAKQKRLRDEKLVPLIAQLPTARVMSEEVDDLLSTDEAMALKMDEIDALEEQLHTIQNLLEGDWFIDYTHSEQPAYIMKFKRYGYHQHRHLYIKHFGHVSHVFNVQPHDMPEEVLESLASASHLATLPLTVSNALEKYEALVLAQEAEETQRLAKEVEDEQKTPKPRTISSKFRKVRNFAALNGPVIVKSGYNKRHKETQ
jgi:hypothetical protein